MRKILFRVIVLWGVVILVCGVAYAQQKLATQKEAEANAKKAVAYYKSVGKEKAFAEFNKPNGQFSNLNKGLYISVYDLSGINVSSGANSAMIGKGFIDLQDPDGVKIIRGLIDIAKTKGKGWLTYKWTNPATKKIEKKTTYLELVDNNYMICCGAYF